MKDTRFYDEESSEYSQKRYPRVAGSYTQFFFNRRLAITKKFLSRVVSAQHQKIALLELGCADGVVVRALNEAFSHAFSKIIGIDISPNMVEEARRKNVIPEAEFLLRKAYVGRPPVDVINETGVVNYAGFDEDLAFVHENLKPCGWYILSVAGTGSLRNLLKHESGFKDFRSYAEYERLIREKFIIHSTKGCGVFVPYVWRIPALARVMHTMLEPVFGSLFPGLCHEKVYLLEKK